MIIDYRVDYKRVVDTITINYADWSYLQLMQIVDIRKYEHLKLVPRALMSSNDFITKVLWTIVREQERVHYTQVNKEFEKATGNLISDYFEFQEDEMKQFLRLKKNVFTLDEKTGYVKAREDFDGETTSSTGASQQDSLNRRKAGAGRAQGGGGGVIVID